jgi:hypothetical protein
MTNETDVLSDDSKNNLFFEENSQSVLFSANSIIDSISTSRTKNTSFVHQHTRAITLEEKRRTKKNYFCKYCIDPNDKEEHHDSTDELRYHLINKHNIV